MTQDRPPPARPWHDLVTREIALRGWTKTELSERSGVARTTIDNWRTNSRRPSAKAVNAVADVLSVDRARAHALAGITEPTGPEPDILPPGLRASIREILPPDSAARVEAAVEAALRDAPPREPPATGPRRGPAAAAG